MTEEEKELVKLSIKLNHLKLKVLKIWKLSPKKWLVSETFTETLIDFPGLEKCIMSQNILQMIAEL